MRLLITSVILTFLLAPPLKDITINTDSFSIKYSQKYEQPLLVKYRVLCAVGKYSRQGLDFYTCDSIHTSNSEDYQNNDYDKGHMAPAADFACDSIKLISTFSYLNCALQHKNLNRGVWKALEDRERVLARDNVTQVKIKVHFSKKSIRLSTGATVPDGFTKEIISGPIHEKYYFPNIKPKYLKYSQYKLWVK